MFEIKDAFDMWYGEDSSIEPPDKLICLLSFCKYSEDNDVAIDEYMSTKRFWYIRNIIAYTRLLLAVVLHFAKFVFTNTH